MRRSVVVVALLAAALVGCAQDRYATSYDDFVAARQQDAVKRGWIPAFLPEQAHDLREVHAPGTGDAVMRATLPGGILPDACAETGEVDPPPLAPSWVSDDVVESGTPVRCDLWQGTLDGSTIVLWTERADEYEPTE